MDPSSMQSQKKRSREHLQQHYEGHNCNVTGENLGTKMRKMINNPDHSDIVFICNDGERVHASRAILVAKGGVFQRMLTNRMAESQSPEIFWREVSSAHPLPVMEFLYTGSLSKFESPHQHMYMDGKWPKYWRDARNIIATARFFLLEELESIATKYVQQCMEALRGYRKPWIVAAFLNDAVEFVSVLEETVKKILHDFVHDLLHNFMEVKVVQQISHQAFQYCLAETRDKTAELGLARGPAAIVEFARFRSMILWCTCQEYNPKEDLTLQAAAIPPEISLVLSLLDRSPDEEAPMGPEQCSTYQTTKLQLAASFQPYAIYVNLRHISATFIIKIVEPLGIIPSSDIVDALGFQALYPDGTLLKPRKDVTWSTLKCTEYGWYNVSDVRLKSEQKALSNGYAVYSMAMTNYECSRQESTYEWEILIDEVCDNFIEIGLYHDEEGSRGPSKEFEFLSIETTRGLGRAYGYQWCVQESRKE